MTVFYWEGKAISLASLIGTNKNNVCAICLDECNGKSREWLLPCQHKFHFDCIHNWFETKRTCPLCRHKF